MDDHRTGPETDRLQHRAFTIEDAEVVFALNSNPEVMRYTGERMLQSLDEAKQLIVNNSDFDEVGYGRWACIDKKTRKVIGFCGLKYLPDLGAVDVGYRLLPRYWGRGLATEACMASLRFGFATLQLDQIIGLVLPDNPASIRVLEKAGMHADGRFDYDGFDVLRYVKRRPEPVNNRVNRSGKSRGT
jgi:ribosomal-protein-alanine N-acetyltransferase